MICRRPECEREVPIREGRKEPRNVYCCRRCAIDHAKETNPYVLGHQKFMGASLRMAGKELGWKP
jgi:hypothetical protein